jgi:hypothetical protein
MASPVNNPFFDSVCYLRRNEELVIYGRYTPIAAASRQAVVEFLGQEYKRECLEFRDDAPDFSGEAAFWGAGIVFLAAQLLVYRDKTGEEMARLLAPYPGPVSAGSIVSADLCLRFLPDVVGKVREVDVEDPLIPILEEHLRQWHYSGVGYPLKPETLDWRVIEESEWLRRRYVDRVIEKRALALGNLPTLRSGIRAAIGNYGTYYWKDYVDQNSTEYS